MRLVARLGLTAGIAVATTAGGYAVAGRTAEPPALGPGQVTVVVDLEHSRLHPSHLRVQAGTTVRFVVDNRDPINHELIVGPPHVHDRHRDGTESAHGAVPGEVSVPLLDTATTTYAFDTVGTIEMACHLPGHYDAGMRGVVEVVAAADT